MVASRIRISQVMAVVAVVAVLGKLVRMGAAGSAETAATGDRSTSRGSRPTTQAEAGLAVADSDRCQPAGSVVAAMARCDGALHPCQPQEQTDSVAEVAEQVALCSAESEREVARASSSFDMGPTSDVAVRRHRITPVAVHQVARRMTVLQRSDDQQPSHP